MCWERYRSPTRGVVAVFVVNRGCRLAYDVVGEGTTVLLQTGLTLRRGDWAAHGYVSAFADSYQVVTTDSLGHGESDRPSDPALYARQDRAADIVAVLDDLGVERAHLIGYSMGAWIASGVLVHHPDRLASLVIGGWDPILGLDTAARFMKAAFDFDMTFESVLAYGRKVDPQSTAWITPDVVPALRCCWDALGQLEGVDKAIRSFERPLLLWDGVDDPYHAAARRLAEKHPYAEFLETPGDHARALHDVDGSAKAGLRDLVDRAETKSRQSS
jgi:pimeloyl-ACP methyl ester carboxylesterase